MRVMGMRKWIGWSGNSTACPGENLICHIFFSLVDKVRYISEQLTCSLHCYGSL